jgi:hypothetical protein
MSEKSSMQRYAEDYIAGATGAVIGESLTIPFDTAKVTMFMQKEVDPRYKSVFTTMSSLKADKGTGALWAGLSGGIARGLIFHGLKVPLYENIKNSMCTEEEKTNTPFMKKLWAGVLSGGIAIAFATPAEGVKVRMQAQARGNAPSVYKGLNDCFRKVYAEHGLKGTFFGLGPNIARNSVMNAAEFIAYDTTKQFVHNNTRFESEQTVMYLFYGLMAGIFGQLTANPIDIIKTRMMSDGARYGTPLNCVKDLVKTEGPLGFYKGLTPGLWRACTFNICFFFGVGFARNMIASRSKSE